VFQQVTTFFCSITRETYFEIMFYKSQFCLKHSHLHFSHIFLCNLNQLLFVSVKHGSKIVLSGMYGRGDMMNVMRVRKTDIL